jgi:hypothetical protein
MILWQYMNDNEVDYVKANRLTWTKSPLSRVSYFQAPLPHCMHCLRPPQFVCINYHYPLIPAIAIPQNRVIRR